MDVTKPGSSEQSSSPPVSLLVYYETARVLPLVEGRPLVVGREQGADLVIDHEKVSRRHARITIDRGQVWVEDLGSTNGTLVNGEEVERVRLGVGDVIAIGPATASIHVQAPRAHGDLDPHDHLRLDLEREVTRSRFFGRPLVLLALRRAPPVLTPLSRLGGALRQQLRPVDRAALYSPEVVELLLPEVGRDHGLHLAQALSTVLARNDEGVLLCGVACHPEHGSAEELVQAAHAALREAGPGQPVRLARAGEPSTASRPVLRSPRMEEIHETIRRLAGSALPVLLLGETGTGKEILARAIHQVDARGKQRLVTVNCAAIPATLIESMLFGHERGAFTGAAQPRAGIFEEADQGTVLLDEVGELSPDAQAALLRVLETKHVSRIGSSREIAVDVRVVAATHRDLETMCVEGRFRWDLFYRLNLMPLRIPPLRERPEEIAPLAELFLRETGAAVRGIDAEAMRLLHSYAWPGNIRELRNAIERAAVIARGPQISAIDLPERVRAQTQGSPSPLAPRAVAPAPGPGGGLRELVQAYERQIIVDALHRAGGVRADAAEALQLPLRTLAHKIKQHGIPKVDG